MSPPCSELKEEEHGEEMGLNLALRDLAHNYWHMTSFRHGKRAGGNLQRGVSYLPFAAMHCGLQKYFSIGDCCPQTLYSFYFYSSVIHYTFFKRLHTNTAFICLMTFEGVKFKKTYPGHCLCSTGQNLCQLCILRRLIYKSLVFPNR